MVLSLLVRLMWLTLVPFALRNDASEYDRLAMNLASTGSFGPSAYAAIGETALRPPAYPTLLAGVYKVLGHHVIAGRQSTSR